MTLPRLSRPAVATVATLIVVLAAGWLLPRSGNAAGEKDTPAKGGGAATANGQANGQAKPVLTVSTAKAQLLQLPQLLAANGDIAAWQEASIGSEANGLRLTEVLVNVGDIVRAGQVLARFSEDTVQADLAQARAAWLEAQATRAEAASNAERARTLANTGALSTQQINQYQTAEQTAKARVAAADAALAAQKLRLKFTQLQAPDDGVISARTATVGAVVANGTELFRMIRKGRLDGGPR